MGAVILVVALLVGLGVLSLAAPDLMWSWTQWNNEMKGLKSERTEWWDTGRVFSGIIMIIVGVGFGLWGCGEASQREAEVVERTAVFEERQATRSAEAIQLDNAFSGAISQLLEMATEDVQTIRAYKLGVETETYTTIDYGRCRNSDDFYMYVFNYGQQRMTYGYGMGRALCDHPDHLYMGSILEMERGESGGTWYLLPGHREPMPTEEAMTPIPATRTPAPEATEE